ncbi:MAG: GntR family transcriptional regulator [Planctomycetota bacterium]|jgi:DNA-binding GntR family transcriptional regulator|nr:GntR family transcriptional regulator [Planctomycetota bacterium]
MSLADQAFAVIQERIVSGSWAPGHALNRRDLAEDLGMSVAPVLEALVLLERQGLVETMPRVGTRVRAITQDGVRGQMLLREAFEVQAVYLLHGSGLRSHRSALLPLAEAADADYEDQRARWAADLAFHQALVAALGEPALTAAYANVMQLGFFHMINVVIDQQPRRRARDSHVRLLRRLLRVDAASAATAIRHHLASGKLALYTQAENTAEEAA